MNISFLQKNEFINAKFTKAKNGIILWTILLEYYHIIFNLGASDKITRTQWTLVETCRTYNLSCDRI